MNLVTLLPNRPQMTDGELNEWLLENGGRGREVLTYRKVKLRNPLTEELEPFINCTCSVCESQWITTDYGFVGTYPAFETADGIKKNGEMLSCPECGAKLEAAYYTRLRRHPIKTIHYPWEIIKADGCIIFLCWAVVYEIDEYGPGIETEMRNAYMLDTAGKWHRFTAMERAGWSSLSPMEYVGEWREMRTFNVVDGGWRRILPHDPAVYEGTALENAKLEKLEAINAGADLLLYARLYMRHPSVENITMTSPQLMAAAMRYSRNVKGLDWINWDSKRPHEMLYMEKQDFRKAATLSMLDACAVIDTQFAVSACELWGAPKSYAKTMGKQGADFAYSKYKCQELRSWSLVRIWNYVLKVAEAMQNKGRAIEEAISLCVDYWEDAKKAKFDTSASAVMFPKDIKAAQARAVMAIEYEEKEEYKAAFAKQAKRLEPLRWECDDLIIIPAKNERELIVEGTILGHCVGGYAASHCAGHSIFFIRQSTAPEVPFYTLQLNTKTGVVMQNRGEKNCNRTPQVAAFEKKWLQKVVLPYIESKQKKNKAPQKVAV